MKCVHTFGTGRHKRQADTTLLFQYILRGRGLKFSIYDLLVSLEIVLTSAKSVDPDEMPHYVPFYLGLHCLQKFPEYKGLLDDTLRSFL